MTSEFHDQQLQTLQQFLTGKGWDTLFEKAGENENYDRLVVKIYTTIEGQDVFWRVEFSFLPIQENNLNGCSILQCFIPVISVVPVKTEPELFEMLTKINPKLPLGAFGFLSSHHLLFYKNNILLDDQQQPSNHILVLETISMASYLLANFYDALANVATGKMSVSEALHSMPFAGLYE